MLLHNLCIFSQMTKSSNVGLIKKSTMQNKSVWSVYWWVIPADSTSWQPIWQVRHLGAQLFMEQTATCIWPKLVLIARLLLNTKQTTNRQKLAISIIYFLLTLMHLLPSSIIRKYYQRLRVLILYGDSDFFPNFFYAWSFTVGYGNAILVSSWCGLDQADTCAPLTSNDYKWPAFFLNFPSQHR